MYLVTKQKLKNMNWKLLEHKQLLHVTVYSVLRTSAPKKNPDARESKPFLSDVIPNIAIRWQRKPK